MTRSALHVLILCTGNSARSLIAEGILRQHAAVGFIAHSAGSNPTGQPNPHAIHILRAHDIDTSFAESKSWDRFAGPNAQPMDLIITVCDNAAGEACPIWPGNPHNAHWGVSDPAAVDGDYDDIAAAFAVTFGQMTRRIEALVAARPERDNLAEIARKIGGDMALAEAKV
tara:strand:- start:1060 stop:1569 length:510 start_codon:yes stop_codon:yes gene_type:complete